MRAPFDPYGAASPAIDQQLGDAFQVVRFVARHIPEIASVAYHMEALYTLASAGGKANADLLGLPHDAKDLGEFEGDLLPDALTVKSALQLIATYVANLKDSVDTSFNNQGNFTGDILPDNAPLHTVLQAIETALEQVFTEAPVLATQDDAEQGTNNIRVMSPLRVKQAVSYQVLAFLLATGEGKGTAMISTIQPYVDAVERLLSDKLSELPSVKDFGAKGDGVTDDTAAFVKALSRDGELYVPDGTYMVDYITITHKVQIRLANGATIKNRVPANPATTLDAHWGIFLFAAGSAGSVVEGGTLDGNRVALAPYYKGHTRLGQDNHWWGIRTEFVDDITIYRTRFRNFMVEAFYAYSGERFRALDIDIADCGVAFAVQGYNTYSTGCVIRATCRNIGNVVNGVPYFMFQHGITFGTQKGFIYEVTLDGFCASKQGVDNDSTSGGKEPVPIGMNFYLLDGGHIDATIRDYTTADGLTSVHQGHNFSSVNNCSGFLSSFGFEQALTMGTSSGNILDVDFDGDYLNVAGYYREGLMMTHGGVSPPNGASLAGEAGSNLSSRDNVIRGTIRRFGIGVRDEGESNDINGLSVYGNVTDGVQLVVPAGTSGSYPATRRRPSGGRDLIGTNVTTNGNAGIIYTGGPGDRIMNCFCRDNGQTFGTRNQPYNVAVVADAGEGVGLRIVGNDVDLTPGVVLSNEVSFVPGSAQPKPAHRIYSSGTALTHTFQLVMRNVNNYRIGEIIRIKSAANGGLDADGKIVDIQEDVVTVAHGAAVAYVEDSVLDTLTGTGSTVGINLTGVGTAFATEVDFPVYLKNGSEYRRIVYVNSNTSAVIDSPFTTALAPGSALKVVRGDVQTGIMQPLSAINVNGNVTVGPMLIQDNYHPNLDNSIVYTSFPGIAEGSRFDMTYDLIMTNTGLDNAIVVGLPSFTQVIGVKVTNKTAITGVTGSVKVAVKDGAGTIIATPINGAVLANGAVNKGAIPNSPAFQSAGGSVNFISDGGNPIGTVSARLSLKKLV